MNEEIKTIIQIVAIIIVILVATRELLLWYWKISEVVQNQKKTNWLLAKLLEQQGAELTEEQKKWLGLN